MGQQEVLIFALQESERMASRLVTEQKVAVKSTLALVKKEKKTKFTSAFVCSTKGLYSESDYCFESSSLG